jgi:hypothetical protein
MSPTLTHSRRRAQVTGCPPTSPWFVPIPFCLAAGCVYLILRDRATRPHSQTNPLVRRDRRLVGRRADAASRR